MRSNPSRDRRRPPAPITAVYLRRVTERYLERYATTTTHLRGLLRQRVRRSAAHHEADPEPWLVLVDQEIARLVEAGLLNDARYAEDRARALNRRGNGARVVREKLAAKGLRGDLVDDALQGLAEDGADPELAAACAWARKRKLGPWASARRDDPDQRRRDLQRFGRAGFSYELARRVLDAVDPGELMPDGVR